MTPVWSFRPMVAADLTELLPLQERCSVAALAHLFPQETHPFPREEVEDRWRREIEEPGVAAYVATGRDGNLVGFAARRADELLHFGTEVATWGSGLAGWLHDQLLSTNSAEVDPLRLRVFAENPRARRFYEKLRWRATGQESRTSFPPHPILVDYSLARADRH